MLLPTWKNFIHSHPINKEVSWSADPQEIIDILNPSHDPLSKDEKTVRLVSLSSCPAVILLTLNPFDHSVFLSFHHNHLNANPNIGLSNKERSLIALTGYTSTATPIFLDIDSIFACTDTKCATPTFRDFLSTFDKPIEELQNITAVDTHHHRKCKAVPIPPRCPSHHRTWNMELLLGTPSSHYQGHCYKRKMESSHHSWRTKQRNRWSTTSGSRQKN